MISGIHNGTWFSSALSIAVPAVVSCSSTAVVGEVSERSASEADLSAQSNASDITMRFNYDAEVWDAEKNGRFRQLASKEAQAGLPVEEEAELDSLSRLRRTQKFPRSAEEILWQRRQQRLTHNLVHALQEYVQFHESPDPS